MILIWCLIQVKNELHKSDIHFHDKTSRNSSPHILDPLNMDVELWPDVSLLSSGRRSVTSTGLPSAQQGTSTLWWIPWRSTTCPSTSSESSRSQTPGWDKLSQIVPNQTRCSCPVLFITSSKLLWLCLYLRISFWVQLGRTVWNSSSFIVQENNWLTCPMTSHQLGAS